jgi:hypothetical protein
MDTADAKRAYALLAVALTRLLNGNEPGARQAAGDAAALPELRRGLAVIEQDLHRLETVRPQWSAKFTAYREMLDLRIP